jgi:2-polyprenyl-3-methyl-5-hydroxy-6-metoxy-1,4-benzoquinol methylase
LTSREISGAELDAASLERLVPDRLDPNEATGAETYRLHIERYEFAAREARPGRFLDLACGAGYGTRLLAERRCDASEIVGVDLDARAVVYASERYGVGDPRLRYAACDALQFSDSSGFDTIVSLETIEHLPSDPSVFVAKLRNLLRPGGVVIASVPTTPSVDLNPHHCHDFSERSFRALFVDAGFRARNEFRQRQGVDVLAVLRGSETRLSGLRPRLAGWYLRHPDALVRRALATLRHGFANRYLSVAWEHST